MCLSLLSPVEPFNAASTLFLYTLAVPQILCSTEQVLASGLDWEGGRVFQGKLLQLSILYRVKYLINLAKNPVSIAPLDQESFLGRNLGHTRRSGYRWTKVSFWCAVSELPCSSQDGWGGVDTVVIGRRALSAYNPSLKPAFMRGVSYFELFQLVLYCRFISTRSCLGRACKTAEGLGSSFLLPVESETQNVSYSPTTW